MPKIVQINVTANWGSTGRIAEGIGECAISNGWESWIAYGRGNPTSKSQLIRVGSDTDMYLHGLQTRIFDNHGLASKKATHRLIGEIKAIRPDIIHLHNIHGYYINYKILFEFLKNWGGPVIWTLHDCWPFTGHCAYFTYNKCDFWKNHCNNCPQLGCYPSSVLIDRSVRNFDDKRTAFLGLTNLTLIPVSNWLANELRSSFLGKYPIRVIHNGINLEEFKPYHTDKEKKSILGVASVWDKRKGLDEFMSLREILPVDYKITLIGLSQKQIRRLPDGINGIQRTDSLKKLAEYYSNVSVFVNPTLEDTFPTTNLEALACGTPVVTYNTGGSPEAVDDKTGIIVPYKDISALASAVEAICTRSCRFSSYECRQRAERFYDQQKVFQRYVNVYNSKLIP